MDGWIRSAGRIALRFSGSPLEGFSVRHENLCMKLSKAQASTFSRLFSAGVFRDLEKHANSRLLARLLLASGLEEVVRAEEPISDVLEAAFRILRLSDLRDDYVYRTALIERILLGRHSLNTASALSEFRVGKSKADVVIINGTSTAYEIKSERDSIARLPKQIDDYRRHFSRVVVVTSLNHLPKVADLVPADVGILTLSKRMALQSVREPIARPDLVDPVSLINSIRLPEVQRVVRLLGDEVPDVANTAIRRVLNETISSKDPVEVHDAVFDVLRRGRSQAPLDSFVRSLPTSLHSIALTRNPSLGEQEHVKSALTASFSEALTWR